MKPVSPNENGDFGVLIKGKLGFGARRRVIVSLTTTPGRIEYLNATIDSIKCQSITPDTIEINIPFEYRKRSLGRFDLTAIPSEIDVYRCDDYGPATKIIPTLQRYKGQDVCIIYCDDDRLYHPNWIERLLKTHDAHPYACVAEEIIQIKNRFLTRIYLNSLSYRLRRTFSFGLWKPRRNDPSQGEIVEGFGGVLVRPEFFDDQVSQIPDEFVMVDDIWISAMLAKNQVPVVFSDRQRQERSKEVLVNGVDLGRAEASLVTSTHEGKGRIDLDCEAILLANRELHVWDAPVASFSSIYDLKKNG